MPGLILICKSMEYYRVQEFACTYTINRTQLIVSIINRDGLQQKNVIQTAIKMANQTGMHHSYLLKRDSYNNTKTTDMWVHYLEENSILLHKRHPANTTWQTRKTYSKVDR